MVHHDRLCVLYMRTTDMMADVALIYSMILV